ncbi:MAG: hypothetical protein U5O69_10350 [Candidatus Competibacteraceae bacterium]|nr:hypothetical protein [Candidatus Competibacteraceae bacterium]
MSATFTLDSHLVSATAGAGGGIEPAARTVAHGATTTFTVTPEPPQHRRGRGVRPTLNDDRHHRSDRRRLHRERDLHPRQSPGDHHGGRGVHRACRADGGPRRHHHLHGRPANRLQHRRGRGAAGTLSGTTTPPARSPAPAS